MQYMINKLRNLRPGESLVYFVGFLDSEKISTPRSDNSIIAGVAYDLALEGKVLLTQKRLSHPITKEGHIDWSRGKGDGFKYIATGAYPKQRKYPIHKPLLVGASS